MRDDLLHVTVSSTLALLRRATMLHPVPATPARPRVPQARTSPGGTSRRAELDSSRSLTERHLRILGVGQPPDRAETTPGPRW